MSERNSPKTTAIVAYITIIGTIIAYFMNLDTKDRFTSFHLRQAFGIHILFYLIGALLGMFNSSIIVGAFYIFFIVLWGYGLFGAIAGKTEPIPFLGPLFQKLFRSIT